MGGSRKKDEKMVMLEVQMCVLGLRGVPGCVQRGFQNFVQKICVQAERVDDFVNQVLMTPSASSPIVSASPPKMSQSVPERLLGDGSVCFTGFTKSNLCFHSDCSQPFHEVS
jgi:hypothetical protein